jgi:hypothetical protein
MPGKKSNKDKSMSKELKERGIERTNSACPWGCGRLIPNGGGPLVAHLGQCKGRSKR